MNKERAKMSKEMAICILKEYKSISEDRKLYHERLILEKKDSDFVLDKEQVQRSEKDIEDFNKNIQALDIAIKSIEHEEKCNKAINDSAKAIAKMQRLCKKCHTNNEWVDVRDRLPSEDGEYLVQLQIDARGKEIYFMQVRFTRFDDGDTEWLYNSFYNAFKNVDPFVIAWKPLPQPYERKE